MKNKLNEDPIPTFRYWATSLKSRMYNLSSIIRVILLQFAILILFGLVLYSQEKLYTFKPFFGPWVLLLVYGGTILLTLVRFFGSSTRQTNLIIPLAREVAIAIGSLTSIAGILLMLSSVTDLTDMPRRLAFCVSGLFHGLLISEVLLAPHDNTSWIYEKTGARIRWLAVGLSGMVIVGTTLFILYVLLLPLNTYTPRHESNYSFSIPIERVSFIHKKASLTPKFQMDLKDILVPMLKHLSYSHRLSIIGEVPSNADCCELARLRLFSVADFLAKSDVPVTISNKINRTGTDCPPAQVPDWKLPKLTFEVKWNLNQQHYQ